MSNIFLFTPKHELDCKRNLADFIELARDRLTVFGADLDWDSNTWPKVGNFTIQGAPARGFGEDQILDAKFIPFAKAYVRYSCGFHGKKLKNEFKALRCIEQALIMVKGVADITLTDIEVLDASAEVAKNYRSTAYQAGLALVQLIAFLNENRLVATKLTWRNPIKKDKDQNRTDAEGKKKREEKMPEDHWLDSMAEMFANKLEAPRDVFTTSIFGLLMSAPSRVSEIQQLPLNCFHREKDRSGVMRRGLRFYGGKGYASDIKYMPTIFEDTAVEAARRLTDLTKPGRELAKWYQDHPNEFYRHENCPNVSEDHPLTASQACEAVGISSHGGLPGLRAYFQSYPKILDILNRGSALTLRDLNDFCRSQLPDGFPWKHKELGIKWSKSLTCFRKHEFHIEWDASPILLWTPGKSTFTTDLNFIPGQENSIWKRHGYRNLDGTEISMTSHQVRHFLNTVAQRGKLGELDIARWSGRADIRQNSTYNHMTESELVDGAREIVGAGLLERVKANAPVSLADLEAVGDGIAHVTIYGFCVHDFSMVPCQRHRDCLNCTEQVCVKGDDEKLLRLKNVRDRTQGQLDKAAAASGDGVYGADRWTQHQLATLERVDQLIMILESPDTPNGAVIRLSNDQEHSILKREIAARSEKLINVVSDEFDMGDLRKMLGQF